MIIANLSTPERNIIVKKNYLEAKNYTALTIIENGYSTAYYYPGNLTTTESLRRLTADGLYPEV